MATANLTATPRTTKGKGAARSLRRSGSVPAVIYGHHREPQAVTIATRELERLLEHIAAGSTVIELDIAGKPSRTLIREIQRHPMKRQILHVDFQELVAGEKVTVQVPLVFVGTPAGVKEGGILDQILHEVEIEVDPAQMPNHLDVDVSELIIGHSLHVSDLKLPEGVTILEDPESTLCVVSAPRTSSDTPVAGVEVIAEAPAEPELIRKTKADEEEGE